ncbi:MAG: DUF4242 domain-containing protein [Fimbriimonadales bacterium]
MPKYVIERDLPGAGQLSPADLKDVARKSNAVLNSIGPSVTWDHSYVTDDKIYCVYDAANEELIRQHATEGGFSANRISKVATIIDPSTAD